MDLLLYGQKLRAMLVAACVLSALGTATAHDTATGVVKQRMDFMKKLGDANKAMANMLDGEAPFDRTRFADDATRIRDHAQHLLHQFPADSLQKPTEALPAIWENWEKFERHSDTLEREAAILVETVRQGDLSAIREQFFTVGDTCKSCHRHFRKKKKK